MEKSRNAPFGPSLFFICTESDGGINLCPVKKSNICEFNAFNVDGDAKDIMDSPLKTNPYRVPEGYFSSLEGKLHDRIENGYTGNRHENAWERMLKPAFGLALSFGLVFAIGFGIMKLSGTSAGVASEEDIISMEEYDLMKTMAAYGFTEEEEETGDETFTDDEFFENKTQEGFLQAYFKKRDTKEGVGRSLFHPVPVFQPPAPFEKTSGTALAPFTTHTKKSRQAIWNHA